MNKLFLGFFLFFYLLKEGSFASELSITNCITDQNIQDVRNRQVLIMENIVVDKESIFSPNLKKIILKGVIIEESKNRPLFRNLPNLEELELDSTGIIQSDNQNLKDFPPNLKKLKLSNFTINMKNYLFDPLTTVIDGCNSLETIEIVNFNSINEDILNLIEENREKLKNLHIRNLTITTPSPKLKINLKGLNQLDVISTNLSIQGR